MPDVTIKNDTSETLNIAWRFVAPTTWNNELKPGHTFSTRLGPIAYTLEIRVDNVKNRFSPEDSWAEATGVVGGLAAGAGGLILGSLWATGLFGGRASVTGQLAATGAGTAIKHAVQANQKFWQNAEGTVLTRPNFWIPVHNVNFAVKLDDSGYHLAEVNLQVMWYTDLS